MSFIEFIRKLFDTSDFPARWHCGSWTDFHGWLHIASDLAIWAAYMAIPISLAFFIAKRRDVPLRGVFWLFIAFILSCGLTHLIEAVIFWEPIYRISAVMKFLTAVISWMTVFALISIAPRALQLPSIQRVNSELEREIENRKNYEKDLARARDELEKRTSQLALEHRRFSAAIQSADVCAVRWDAETGDVLWSIGFEHILSVLGAPRLPFTNLAVVTGPDVAEQIRLDALRVMEADDDFSGMYEIKRTKPAGIAHALIAACPEQGSGSSSTIMAGTLRIEVPENTCEG